MNRRKAITAGLAVASAVATFSNETQAAEAAENPELEKVRAMLKAHDEAFSNQDFAGVMATMAENATLMGTGPGEIWTGAEELKDAYEHFFTDFDKGHQKFEYQFKIGKLGKTMGWMMASGNVSGEKDGKSIEFPLNLSVTVTHAGSEWKIAAMHFSTLVGPDAAKK
jgi:ketosteroid isomerase-like protein